MVERAASTIGRGQEELEIYLACPQFSQKIICPRTSLQISFSQIGDPEGCPVLFVPPAVCSRWFAVPLGVSNLRIASNDGGMGSWIWLKGGADDRSYMSRIRDQVGIN